VSNNGGDSVGEYNATTGAAINASFITAVHTPNSLQLDAFNHLFVTTGNGGSVSEYDATTGAAINPNFITGLNVTFGLALDGGDHLFATSLSSTDVVGEYNAITGAAINSNFITGLNGPIFITVVPEPSSLALASGVAAIGLVARSQRRRLTHAYCGDVQLGGFPAKTHELR
jgi:hypothetical protein